MSSLTGNILATSQAMGTSSIHELAAWTNVWCAKINAQPNAHSYANCIVIEPQPACSYWASIQPGT